MERQQIIFIILSFITALSLALFQYWYKEKKVNQRQFVLVLLRFVSIFSILMLLVNPKLEKATILEVKPKLVMALDNSASINHLDQNEVVSSIFKNLSTDKQLNDKFDLDSYTFGKDLKELDSLSFDEPRSDYYKLFSEFSEVYRNSSAPIILISDGNQTYGSDYEYLSSKVQNPVFPVIIGDTTSYEDLSIVKVNHNRYVFYKNKFEVEIIAAYSGTSPVTTNLVITNSGSPVFSKTVNFDSQKNSELFTAVLPANTIGIQNYKVHLKTFNNEKNIQNNTKEFGIEIIDQKTNVAIVSSRPHPDLGALKKAIISNEQRNADIVAPNEYLEKIDDYQLVILYQPDNSFSTILKTIFEDNINTFLIGGQTTNWTLVNDSQKYYIQEITNQEESYQPSLNATYAPFILNNIDFIDYPPVKSEFGSLSFNTVTNTLLYKVINGNRTSFPLLSSFEDGNEKHAVLLGEGIWRWRAQSFLNTGDFDGFDEFIGKMVQYLSSRQRRTRLVVDYETLYNSSDEIVLNAQFFNKSYEFDKDARLSISLKNTLTNETNEYPLLLSGGSYSIDLTGTESGSYNFTIRNLDEPISKSGSFKVISFNIEQQFLAPNKAKLLTLANNTEGAVFFPNTIQELKNKLLDDQRFQTIQKEIKTVSPLIDWKYLLGLIALALSLEWFIRKYNGLI